MKKILSFLLPILCMMILVSCTDETEDAFIYDYSCWGDITLWADFTGEERTSRAIRWQENDDGPLSLYLPSAMNEFYIWFDGAEAVKIDGAGVRAGDLCAISDGEHTLTVGENGEKSYTFNVMRSADVPSVVITTASGSMDDVNASSDHSVYDSGSIYIRDESGNTEFMGDMAKIRGRGNSSWGYSKKSYQFKLAEKNSLFGMAETKTWLLLASHNDPSLIRNSFYFELAERTGIPFTCDYIPCDVWANGVYLGSYLLCEKIDIGDGRVEITDLEKANEEADPSIGNAEYETGDSMRWCTSSAEPDDITGGYLLETDYSWRWEDEDCGFVTKKGMYIVIKSPSNATYSEVKYIRDLVCEMEDALYADDGKNSLGKHYTEYIDTESLAAMQIIDELSMRLDAGLSSFYFYKDSDRKSDGLIRFAPIWDFDFSNGNTVSSASCPDDWWWTVDLNIAESRTPGWYAAASRHNGYRETLCKVYRERFADVLPEASEIIKSLSDKISASQSMNFDVWDFSSLPALYIPEECDTYDDMVAFFSESFEKRTAFLDSSLTQKTLTIPDQPVFYDLPDDAETAEAILYVYEKEWMSGTDLYTFAPDTPLTRGMLAVLLVNTLDGDASSAPLADFDDIKEGQWYTESVSWCVQQGIFDEGGSFLPWETVDAGYLYQTLSRTCDRIINEPSDSTLTVTRAIAALELYRAFGE